MLVLFPIDRGEGQANPASLPVLQLDIRALGYTPEPLPFENYGQLGIDPISFTSDDTLAITFVTRDAPAALSVRGQVTELLPYRLHALFVDAKTSKVMAEHDWPSSSPRSRVLPTTGQRFVVLTPDRLLLYSPEFSLLTQLDLPWGRDAIKNQWEVARSPGGRYLLASYEPESDERRLNELPPAVRHSEPVEVRFEWIDLEDLHVVASWTTLECVGCFWTEGISDDGLVQRWNKVPGGMPFGSEIVEIGKPPDGPWRDFCPYYQPYCRRGKFINDDTILAEDVSGGLQEIWLVGMKQGLLFHEEFHHRETLYSEDHAEWVVSANGKRFAAAVMQIKGANAFLDIGGHADLEHILIYDIRSRQWIYRLDGKKQKIKNISGMALSPNGSLLALITQDGVLQIYRMPNLPAQPN